VSVHLIHAIIFYVTLPGGTLPAASDRPRASDIRPQCFCSDFRVFALPCSDVITSPYPPLHGGKPSGLDSQSACFIIYVYLPKSSFQGQLYSGWANWMHNSSSKWLDDRRWISAFHQAFCQPGMFGCKQNSKPV